MAVYIVGSRSKREGNGQENGSREWANTYVDEIARGSDGRTNGRTDGRTDGEWLDEMAGQRLSLSDGYGTTTTTRRELRADRRRRRRLDLPDVPR